MKIKFLFIFIGLSALVKAQAFKEGDLVLNGNVGVPNLAATFVKVALRVAYPTGKVGNSYSLNFSNTPVFSGRAEYAVTKKFGIGLSVAYWKMQFNLSDGYQEFNPNTNMYLSYIDRYNFTFSALAIGVRANYHFGKDKSKVDPYIGGALGLTKYSSSVGFTSTYEGRQLPALSYAFKSGFGTYIAPTFGLRVYPAKWLGLNFELGYDKGALLMAGIALKINTKNE